MNKLAEFVAVRASLAEEKYPGSRLTITYCLMTQSAAGLSSV